MTKTLAHDLGIQWRFEDYLVLFGDQRGKPELFSQQFPHFEERKIKQVHGDTVVEASTQIVEADAHFTRDPFLALQIKTADCLPIFAVDPVQKNIVGIHAGWRGVASQITLKSLHKLVSLGGQPENFRVVIGPHIRKQSFEVDEPVWAQLMDSIPATFNHEFKKFYEPLPNEKFKIDLEGIVRTQIKELKVPEKNIDSVEIDTLSNQAWHSFRRDKEQSGRNVSFIARFK